MKVYLGNYDGRRYAMVAAKSQREAAEAIGTSLYDFRKYFSQCVNNDDIAIAVSAPGTVFVQVMNQQAKWTVRK